MGKLSDLHEMTAPAPGDLALVRDISGGTDPDKKMQLTRFADIYLRSDVLLVDQNFDSLGAAWNRFTTISSALAAASPGATILVAAGTYTENLVFGDNNISLIGAGQPYFDGADLVGGTIIKGEINTNSQLGPTIRDLGIDIRYTDEVDGINIGSTVGGMQYQTFENLTMVGKGGSVVENRGHGILCSSGGGNTIRNCKIYSFYHGIALRCSYSTISDCYFWGCQSNSIIIKSEVGSLDAVHNAVTNCILSGDSASGYTRAGPIRVQAANSAYVTKYNTISNITVRSSGQAAIIIEAVSTAALGNVGWTAVSNVTCFNGGDSSIRAEFDMTTTTDNTFVNCHSTNRAAGYGWRQSSDCARIRAIGCLIDSSGAGQIASGSFLMNQDFGGGGGIQVAAMDGLYFVDKSSYGRVIDRGQILCGVGATGVGVTESIVELTNVPGTGSSSIAVELTITLQSGGIARLYHYHISIVRPNSSSLAATVEAIGTAGLTAGTGSAGTLSVTVDVATANVAKIQVTGASYAAGYAYMAKIVTVSASVWKAANLAA